METVELTKELDSASLFSKGRLISASASIDEGSLISRHGLSHIDCLSVSRTASDFAPSRSLELTPISTVAAEVELREKLKNERQLSLREYSPRDGRAILRFYDIRDSVAAREKLDNITLDEVTISATFSADNSSRDFDEEGRIVVQVNEQLSLNQLYHTFSTYGEIRNIHCIPNVDILRKVVEYYDIRDAQGARVALQDLGVKSFLVSGNSDLEETSQSQRSLIQPRLCPEIDASADASSSMTTTGDSTSPVLDEQEQSLIATKQDDVVPPLPLPKKLILKKAVNSSEAKASRTLRDSFSSLPSTEEHDDSEANSPYKLKERSCLLLKKKTTKTKLHSQLFSFPESTAFSNSDTQNQSQSEDCGELSLEDILPSGLGLYKDDEPCIHENTSPLITRAAAHSKNTKRLTETGMSFPYSINDLNQTALNSCLANQQLLNNSLLSHLASSHGSLANGGAGGGLLTNSPGNTFALAQYLDELQQATVLQQLVNLEVMKRLNALKHFNCNDVRGLMPNIFPYQRTGGAMKKSEKNNRKKNKNKQATDPQEVAEHRAQQDKMFAMDLDRVKSGEDQRTTLMIKNIPNKYTQKLLLERIEEEFKGMFDFLYLPIDFKNKCNVGYGFINMRKLEYIPPFVEHIHEQKWDKFNSEKVCCVTYARIQGLSALIHHFQNSNIMLEESTHQPLLFDANGDPEPFSSSC
eukprot:g8219.t1